MQGEVLHPALPQRCGVGIANSAAMLPPKSRGDQRSAVSYTPPRDRSAVHRPPLSFVVIPECLQDPDISAMSRKVPSPLSATPPFQGNSFSGQPRNSSTPASAGASFRLQPRGKHLSSGPAFNSASSKGRKRNARCLNSCSTTVVTELFPSGDSFSSIGSPVTSDSLMQPAVESAMQSLSIKPSRFVQEVFSSPSLHRPVPPRSMMGSSFIMYSSSSPSDTSKYPSYLRPRGECFGSCNSPKPVPLKVIPKPAANSTTTPTKRPLHGGPSSLLFSLDGNHDQSDDDDFSPNTPSQKLPATFDYSHSVQYSTMSSTPKKITPARPPRKSPPETPEHTATRLSSPLAWTSTSNTTSPGTPNSRAMSVQSTCDTRLPHVKLPPRNAPRIGASTRGLSFPSPSHEFGFLPIDFSHAAMLPPTSAAGMMPLSSFDNMEFPSARSPSIQMPNTRASYLPIPNWCEAEYMPKTPHFRLLPDELKTSPSLEHKKAAATHIGGTSLLTCSTGMSSSLQTMMRRQEEVDDDGSLSDPDEEEPFVLTDPSKLTDERMHEGPARQRQRRSLDQNSLRPSSLSLNPTHASNGSLLGEDLVRGDSTASLSRHNLATNSRNPSFKMDTQHLAHDENVGSTLVRNSRSFSEDSLSSLGLELEAPYGGRGDGADRDLITPPQMVEESAMFLDPLSTIRGNKKCSVSTTPRQACASVCPSGSDPSSVNYTITRMVFRSGHNHPLSPQMMCNS